MAETKPIKPSAYVKDLTGLKFGRLTVVRFAGVNKEKAVFECLCECSAVVFTNGNSLQRGQSKSCGCQKLESFTARVTVHGMVGTPEYTAWKRAKNRCFNPNGEDYDDYGARGITMCDEWRDNFMAFLQHIGKRPDGHSLDRIDVNRGYEPGNVQWATPSAQSRNQRRTIRVSHNGEFVSLPELAERTGIRYATLYSRHKNGRRLL